MTSWDSHVERDIAKEHIATSTNLYLNLNSFILQYLSNTILVSVVQSRNGTIHNFSINIMLLRLSQYNIVIGHNVWRNNVKYDTKWW